MGHPKIVTAFNSPHIERRLSDLIKNFLMPLSAAIATFMALAWCARGEAAEAPAAPAKVESTESVATAVQGVAESSDAGVKAIPTEAAAQDRAQGARPADVESSVPEAVVPATTVRANAAAQVQQAPPAPIGAAAVPMAPAAPVVPATAARQTAPVIAGGPGQTAEAEAARPRTSTPAEAPAQIAVRDSATGMIYCRSRRFLVPFESADAGPSGVKAVRLYYTCDNGRAWTLYGERPEPKGSFEFLAPGDGTYGFTVQALDRAGNVEGRNPTGATRPEISVVVDTRCPLIEPVFPRQDMELAPGARLRVRFKASDEDLAPSTAAIFVKLPERDTWEALPNVTSDNAEFYAEGEALFAGKYAVRVSVADRAGNVAENTYTFVCTPNARPTVRPRGPVGRDWEVQISSPPRARSLVFDIDYKVANLDGQPPAKVGLYYTTDNGATWQFYGLNPDVTPPMRFQAPREGVYGFKIVAESRSGVSEAAPVGGTKPDITTLVDVTYPTLMLDEPRGGESYQGGLPHYIRWTAKDANFGSVPITLSLSRDGGQWQVLAADLPNTGSYGWNVPMIDYAVFRLKVEARDMVGNVTSVVSDDFSVVSSAPETKITAVVPAAPELTSRDLSPSETELVQPSIEATAPADAGKPLIEPTAPPSGANAKTAADLLEKAAGQRLRGDYEGAEKSYHEAIRFDKDNVEARTELGGLLLQVGRQQEAVGILQEARRLAPKDTDVLYNLGGAYYALGNYPDSAAAFETLAQIDAQNDAALWNAAKAYFAAGDVSAARRAWQRITALNRPGSPFVKKAQEALASVGEPKTKKK